MDLKQILEDHVSWLNGSGGKRANISGANLRGANLHRANLHRADLSGANLSGADLSGANLRGADLSGANLRGANLSWVNLSWVNLYGANLSGVNLYGADLRGANLSWANLSWADLHGAKLAWTSHDLLFEILRQESGDDVSKRKIAGLIIASRDWCWEQFLAIDDPLRGWVLETLKKYITPGDNHPEVFDGRSDTDI